MNRFATFSVMALASFARAGLVDSLSMRFGAGVSKPWAREVVENSIPGTGFERRLPTLFTAVVSSEATLRRDRWEGGLAFGIDGEVLSVQRLDASGFSVAHLSALGAFRILSVGDSRLWVRVLAGWGVPVMRHDNAAVSDPSGGMRLESGLCFSRGGVRVVLGASRGEVEFESRNGSVETTNHWETTQAIAMMQWDWIAP